MLFGGGAATLYVLVYVPIVEPLLEQGQQLERINTMNKKIERQAPFSPPADSHLAEEQVERFLAVQRAVYDSAHVRLHDAVTTLQKLKQKDQSGEEPGFKAVMDWFSSMSTALKTAKRMQVQALNTQNFSLSEYRWVRTQVFHAASWRVAPLGVETAISRWAAGVGTKKAKSFEDSVPPHNRALVAPHQRTLDSLEIVARLGF